MAQMQQTRASPDLGFSITYRVMDDAVTFYLANGGVQKAREHIEHLVFDLDFYPDIHNAYMAALARINEAERDERMKAEERSQQQLRDMITTMMGAMRPALTPADDMAEQDAGPVVLPEVLCSDKALSMLKKAQEARLLDSRYQPYKISRTQAAILADEIAMRLKLTPKWKPFELLWHRNNMRSDYNTAVDQPKALKFREELKALFSDI